MGGNLGSSRPTYPPLPFPGGRTEPRAACFVSPRGWAVRAGSRTRPPGPSQLCPGPGFRPPPAVLVVLPLLCRENVPQGRAGCGSPGVAFPAKVPRSSLGGLERVPASRSECMRPVPRVPGGPDGGRCSTRGSRGGWDLGHPPSALGEYLGAPPTNSVKHITPKPFLDWYVCRVEAAEGARAWAVG